MSEKELNDLIECLEKMPVFVERLAGEFANAASWKFSQNEFSLLEKVCHLNDIEREGYAVRIAKMLDEHQPFLPDVDGGKLAAERDYNSRNLAEMLHSFAAARQENIETIKNLSLEQLSRSGEFENAGAVTLWRVLTMMREHDAAHVAELNDLRGKLAQQTETAK
jgi:hypothetical protein